MKAARGVSPAAGDGHGRRPLAQGRWCRRLVQLKGGGAKHVLQWLSALHRPIDAMLMPKRWRRSQRCRLYVYRHTKPSAPAAVKLVSASALVCGARRTSRPHAGRCGSEARRRPLPPAWRWRANAPIGPATTAHRRTTWPSEARALGKSHGLKVEVLERKDVEKLGMGCPSWPWRRARRGR